jgi:hypothetical protein
MILLGNLMIKSIAFTLFLLVLLVSEVLANTSQPIDRLTTDKLNVLFIGHAKLPVSLIKYFL